MGKSWSSPAAAPRNSEDGPLPVPGGTRGHGSPPLASPPVGLRTIYGKSSYALIDGWFFARVEKTPTCWLWRGNQQGFGYGSGPRGIFAHRWAYERFVGPIPPGKYVLHHCDTPLCVNPKHLFLGTQQDNLNDAIVKGRMSHGTRRYNAKLTDAIVAQARRLWHQGASIWGLAREYKVSTHTMDHALKGKTWKHVK